MKFAVATLAAASALVCAVPAHAVIFTYTGNTTGQPTYTRPLESLGALSAVGVGVAYQTFEFSVGANGDYTFLTTGEFDTFLTLYAGSFNPLDPLSNGLIANDDLISPPFTTSGFAATLNTATSYVLVVTGFAPTDFGAYSTTIGGPGAIISTIPEPASYGLMALGALGVMALRRRRERAANEA
ncbi:MAG: PEP-CTERM sorting domain-containing protein [Rubrivivax sp.]|nr:PEP-CTERM sorting domain-containing protein [Rubrivivax sp.]